MICLKHFLLLLLKLFFSRNHYSETFYESMHNLFAIFFRFPIPQTYGLSALNQFKAVKTCKKLVFYCFLLSKGQNHLAHYAHKSSYKSSKEKVSQTKLRMSDMRNLEISLQR